MEIISGTPTSRQLPSPNKFMLFRYEEDFVNFSHVASGHNLIG